MTEQQTFPDLLALEEVDRDIFRGRCRAGAPLRAFGGQVAAQALVAAGRTVEDARHVHSLHGYFLRPGRPADPIVYLVDRIRDGRTFTTRRATGVQYGEAIFTLAASFKLPEEGVQHQRAMPDVPMPDDLPDVFAEWAQRDPEGYEASTNARVLEMRIASRDVITEGAPRQYVWMKSALALPDDPLLHVCTLAYMSDLTLASTSSMTHEDSPGELQMASLDHAMWFHREFRADEWLLFAQESPSASDGRGLSVGLFFSREGRLVASVMQEALLRRPRT